MDGSSEHKGSETDAAVHTPQPGAEGMAKRVDRREALKKAAIGGAVAGAAWMAPKVDGLTLVPDYAAAGTVVAGAAINFRINSGDNNNGGDTNNYYTTNNDRNNRPSGLNGCTPANDWFIAVNPQNTGNPVPITISPGFPANNQNQNVTMSAPLGPAGNVVVTIPAGADADIPGNTPINVANVAFNIDPPFNKCRVESVVVNKCNAPGPAYALTINNQPGPGVTNPAPYTTGIFVNAPQPSNVGDMTIQVKCS